MEVGVGRPGRMITTFSGGTTLLGSSGACLYSSIDWWTAAKTSSCCFLDGMLCFLTRHDAFFGPRAFFVSCLRRFY